MKIPPLEEPSKQRERRTETDHTGHPVGHPTNRRQTGRDTTHPTRAKGDPSTLTLGGITSLLFSSSSPRGSASPNAFIPSWNLTASGSILDLCFAPHLGLLARSFDLLHVNECGWIAKMNMQVILTNEQQADRGAFWIAREPVYSDQIRTVEVEIVVGPPFKISPPTQLVSVRELHRNCAFLKAPRQ